MLGIFIQYPFLAAVPGVLFVYLGLQLNRPIGEVTGGLWLLYTLYEFGMKTRVLCSGECNIRVDLLLIYPVLALFTIGAVISLLKGKRPDSRNERRARRRARGSGMHN
jgi:hypothetical protein